MGSGDLGGPVVEHLALVADLLQADRFPGGGTADLPALKQDLAGAAMEKVGGDGAQPLFHLVAGFFPPPCR